ncbi:hypothetical protein DFH06DRAFT_1253519 [Mycena polygramma]|nr:hypothetical protein DFH06DRAFT_1253519 [Mycena polygramma]
MQCATCANGFTSSLVPTARQTLELMDILRSNAVVPDAASFTRTISAAPMELARYDAEMERVQTLLAKLSSERSALAAYADGCSSAFAPIPRLPAELLAEIFDLCSPSVGQHNLTDSTLPEEEVNRLSNWHLLQLSQVSSLWHKIAMETPKLWSTIVLDTALWQDTTLTAVSLLSLLDLTLKRGGNHPLTMLIGVLENNPYPHAVMALLANHAPRWKDVNITSDLGSAYLLPRAKGKLERLQTLTLCAEWPGVDSFRVAPQSTDVAFYGRVANVPNLPWTQLRKFSYFGDANMEPFTFMSFLARCPNILTFTADVDLSQSVGMEIPALSSNVEVLTFRMGLDRLPAFAPAVVCDVFSSLTLLCVRSIAVTPRLGGRDPPPAWHTEQFLVLADRSACHSHLTELEINAIITDKELLRCLAVLPLLQALSVSDSALRGEYVVVTDTLLHDGCT